MRYVDKTYGHERGYSCCFRQPLADSHCREPHGYALSFRFRFACNDDEVDKNGWVIDFGGLKPLKSYLDDHFDHRLLLAARDPAVPHFQALYKLLEFQPPIVLPMVGCEAFAEHMWQVAKFMLMQGELGDTRAWIHSVEVREHGSNGATYVRD